MFPASFYQYLPEADASSLCILSPGPTFLPQEKLLFKGFELKTKEGFTTNEY